MFNETIPEGSKRQRSSGALIFPISPSERKAQERSRQLDEELAEVRALKKELQDFLKESKK